MTDLFTSRRRAERFARVADGEDIVHDATLAPLVATATALRAVAPVEPRAQFRDTLRTHLMSAAAVELVPVEVASPARRPAPTPDTERRRRRMFVAASALVLVGGTSGVAAASQQALPGDTLYPVKRGIEQVELVIAGSERSEGRELLEQADSRLSETQGLVARGVDDARVREDVTTTLQDFATHAGRGGELLVESYRGTGSSEDLMQVRTFSRQAADQLGQLTTAVPPESRTALRDAVLVVQALDTMALRACPECTSALPPLDLGVDLLSLPAGDGSFLVPGVPPKPQGEAAGGRDGGSVRGRSPDAGDGAQTRQQPEQDTGLLPLPTLPDPAGGETSEPTEPADDGLLDDDGLLGSDGPVLGDDGVAGSDGPVLGDDGVAGSDGPVLGDDGVAGSDGPVLGDDGILGSDGPVLDDDGVVGGVTGGE